MIDDYFCIGAKLLSAPPLTSFASNALAQARQAYDKRQLEGSPEKDIINANLFKAAGAAVDSRPSTVALGLTSVACPLSRRIGLSTLTLRAAALPLVTTKLASRLFSVLLYSIGDAFLA